jgi:hypothetical protein
MKYDYFHTMSSSLVSSSIFPFIGVYGQKVSNLIQLLPSCPWLLKRSLHSSYVLQVPTQTILFLVVPQFPCPYTLFTTTFFMSLSNTLFLHG